MENIVKKLYNGWNSPDCRTRKVNRNIVYSMFLKGFGIMISLIIVPLTLGYLNEYEYGIWITLNTILTWIYYFDIGLGNGLRNKLTEAIASNDLKLGKVYVSTTLFLLIMISGIMCICTLFANQFINWNEILNINKPIDNLNTIVNIVLICVCLSFSLRTVGTIHISYQNPWVNDLLTVLGSLLSLIWIYCLTKWSEPSLLKVAIAFSLSPLIIYIISYPVTFIKKYKSISPSIRHIKFKYAKSLTGLGVKFFFLQIACLVLFSTSNVIVSNIFTPAEVTPYSIANKYFNVVVMVFNIVINPIWSAITDAYSRKDLSWIKNSMRKLFFIMLGFDILLLIMVLVSKFIFSIWIGSKTEISYSLSLSIAVFNIVYLFSILYSAYSNGVGHLKLAMWSMCSAAILFIPLSMFIAENIGIIGVGYSMALVMIIPSVALLYQYIIDMRELKDDKQ